MNIVLRSVCGWCGVERPPTSRRSQRKKRGNSEIIPCSTAWIAPGKASWPSPVASRSALSGSGTVKYSASVSRVVSGRSSDSRAMGSPLPRSRRS
jgi:hypothetical protein